MRKILSSLCIGILAFALSAQGAEVKKTTTSKGAARGRSTAHVQTNKTFATHANVNSGARMHVQHNQFSTTNRTRSHALSTSTRTRNHAVTSQNNSVAALNTKTAARTNTARNVTVNQQRNLTRNAVVTNNWRAAQFTAPQYSAFQNYRRAYHDRNWWSNHYDRIVFVSGGWYYWNSGYWYPAWGYAPGGYYPYDGPIYGYNDLSPDRVVVEVQSQLQRDGYYAGAVDGVLGRRTRAAIAAFQADHGLAVTSAIDQPTLATLGLA